MHNACVCLLAALLPLSVSALDYSHYRGDGSGAAPDSGLELVKDMKEAKLLWSSTEAAAPMGIRPKAPNKRPWKHEFPGGFGVPILHKGKVYLTIAWPSGPEIVHTFKKREDQPYWLKANADEIVYCLDAETGKTLWKTVHAGSGWNFQPVYPSDGQITACVDQNRLVFLGTTGNAYCLDAETGQTLWQRPSGTMALAWEAYKKEVLEGKAKAVRQSMPNKNYVEQVLAPRPPRNPEHGGSGGGGFNSTPRIFGDLAIFNVMGKETVAFDLESGDERWRIKGIAGPSCSVIKWTHGGKDYLIGSTGCYEPATGKKLWGFPGGELGGPYQGSTWAVSGDYLVGAVPNRKPRQERVKGEPRAYAVCFQMTPSGAKKVWQNPYAPSYMSPIIYRGHAYLHSRVRAGYPLPKAYPAVDFSTVRSGKFQALVCIDITSGVVKGIGKGVCGAKGRYNTQGTSPFAMDGRVITVGAAVLDTVPDELGQLNAIGDLHPRAMGGTFPTGAGGLIYLRPEDDSCLLQCWDLRAHKGD